jgi:Rho termination factor, N-terminal domain
LAVVKWGILATSLHHAEEVATVPNPSIKNEKMYQDLRREGSSKEKAARISNAAAARGGSSVGRKGGKAGSYTDWTVPQLKKRAKELGISGYSGLTKDKLIAKLRNR